MMNVQTDVVRLNAELIRELIRSRNMCPNRFSKATGISRGHVSRILSGSVKNKDGTSIGTAMLIANLFNLPLSSIVLPSTGRWHFVDRSSDSNDSRFLEELAHCKCILSASESGDSYILPTQTCETIESLRLKESQYNKIIHPSIFNRHKNAMKVRRKIREEGTHFHQIVSPCNVWSEVLASIEEEHDEIKNNIREFKDLTAVAYISKQIWDAAVSSIAPLGFPGWSKINVIDEVIAAIWFQSEAFITTEKTTVTTLRNILEKAGRSVSLPRFGECSARTRRDDFRACNDQAIAVADRVLHAKTK